MIWWDNVRIKIYTKIFHFSPHSFQACLSAWNNISYATHEYSLFILNGRLFWCWAMRMCKIQWHMRNVQCHEWVFGAVKLVLSISRQQINEYYYLERCLHPMRCGTMYLCLLIARPSKHKIETNKINSKNQCQFNGIVAIEWMHISHAHVAQIHTKKKKKRKKHLWQERAYCFSRPFVKCLFTPNYKTQTNPSNSINFYQ